MSIISKSTSEISPIPHLQSDSTVKLPTPPIPNSITLDFFKNWKIIFIQELKV